MNRIVAVLSLTCATLFAQAPRPAPTPAQSIRNQFAYVNGKLLEMANDFPESKYDFKLTKEMRSFGDVIVHIASGNVYGAKAGRGEDVKWDEMDPKDFKGKAAIVAVLQKSFDDATATLKNTPDDRFKETLAPWGSVIEHAAEHYGLLVAYYRANGLVPPESRPKSK